MKNKMKNFEEKIIIDESECLIENVKLINKLKVTLRLALNFRFIQLIKMKMRC